jgi:HEAT repeat protein
MTVSTAKADQLQDDWNDFLHYTKIGLFDIAKGHGQNLLDSKPDPVAVLELIEANQTGYAILLRARDNAPDKELAQLSSKILGLIEEGRFIRRADPKIIAEEIRRLSSTARGRLAAVGRLKNTGEYAIAYMLDAMADNTRKEELPNIIWALPQIGRSSIRPLIAALQTDNVLVKTEVVKALGKIGYRQPLSYLKYILEKDESAELRELAEASIRQIDSASLKAPAADLFFQLADEYYYHTESLAPAEDASFANIWFWNTQERRLVREKVDKKYFNELMAMRNCEWALKADAGFGKAIGLWLASFFKAEATDLDMPAYFGESHAKAMVYATTAGAEYLHQALARALKDGNADVALGTVEALATTAGEKSLFYRIVASQPLLDALSFNDKAVRYSAAIAIAQAGPTQLFAEKKLVVKNLAEALEAKTDDSDSLTSESAQSYALRSADVMLKSAITRNAVIDLELARKTLIEATKDDREDINVLAAQILARLGSTESQRAIAAMALSETKNINIKIAAFEALAISAKLNANKLNDETIDAIYKLTAARDIDPELRSAAASAFGALNLPSRKVKDLILDQVKS